MAHQAAELLIWANDLWLTGHDDYWQLMSLALIFIVACAVFSLLEGRSKKKPKYHRRTSHVSVMGGNRQFLEEAV